MAIGKTKVATLNKDRIVFEKTASGDELAICRFNGKQRDAFMSLMFKAREQFGINTADTETPATAEEMKNRVLANLSVEKAQAMTNLEYRLLFLTVIDGDTLPDGDATPLFGSPEEVAEKLEPETIREWVALCQKVNGLGEAAEKAVAADFSKTPSDGSGSASPGCAAAPTFPG